jgi:ATP-dependent Clp protease ATP-binding subunit ClpC
VFSRFSPASRRVLRAAEQAARNHNHYYVGVEHLCLALLGERDPAVEARLRERGIEPAELDADLRRVLGTGEDRMWDGILVTPRVRTIVGIAERSVDASAVIEPSDLLEAIVAEGGSATAAILTRRTSNLSS